MMRCKLGQIGVQKIKGRNNWRQWIRCKINSIVWFIIYTKIGIDNINKQSSAHFFCCALIFQSIYGNWVQIIDQTSLLTPSTIYGIFNLCRIICWHFFLLLHFSIKLVWHFQIATNCWVNFCWRKKNLCAISEQFSGNKFMMKTNYLCLKRWPAPKSTASIVFSLKVIENFNFISIEKKRMRCENGVRLMKTFISCCRRMFFLSFQLNLSSLKAQWLKIYVHK